jgi:hypothetical protein
MTPELPFHIGPLHMIAQSASDSTAYEQLFLPGLKRFLYTFYSNCSRALAKSSFTRKVDFSTTFSSEFKHSTSAWMAIG